MDQEEYLKQAWKLSKECPSKITFDAILKLTAQHHRVPAPAAIQQAIAKVRKYVG